MTRPRIAWFSPLQPVESGISLYSEDILPVLASVMDIDVIVDGYMPTVLQTTGTLQVRAYRDFRVDRYDLVIYQLGNSPVHLYMLPELARTPGLLVLHDTILNHLFVQQAARNGTLLQYRETMERRYGADGGRAADRVLKGQAPDDLFRFPMSETVVEGSYATVVHSEYARQQVLTSSPGARVVRVPHGLRLPEYLRRSEARRMLGVPEDQFLIASISHINPHKRIDVVLRAFKTLRRSVPARLILAGSVSSNFPLSRMVSHLGLDQVVDMPGYVSDREARLIAAAADVIVNLRYPTAGETSGSLLHSMAAGRPVLVTQTGSFSEIPENTVVRVPVDALEESMLVAVFQRLAADPELGEQIGQRARAFIKREHSLQRWADGYVDVIANLCGGSIGRPVADTAEEQVSGIYGSPHEHAADGLSDSLAQDIAELGLGGDESLLEDIARARVELGMGVGMISAESHRRQVQSEGENGNGELETD